jgi:hypothetical protein
MTVSLDFIATQLQRVFEGQQEAREDMRQVRADLAELRRDLEQQRDETVVTSGMVMRYGAGTSLGVGAEPASEVGGAGGGARTQDLTPYPP